MSRAVFAAVLQVLPALAVAAEGAVEAVPPERASMGVILTVSLAFIGLCVWFVAKVFMNDKKSKDQEK